MLLYFANTVRSSLNDEKTRVISTRQGCLSILYESMYRWLQHFSCMVVRKPNALEHSKKGKEVFHWYNMRNLRSSGAEMCVNVCMHFPYMILRMLHGTSFQTPEFFANCHYAATLHTLLLAWLMKFLIRYMRMHGESISANIIPAVLR